MYVLWFLKASAWKVAEYFDRAVEIVVKVKKSTDSEVQAEIGKWKVEVEEFAKQFPTIGFEKSSMKYQD